MRKIFRFSTTRILRQFAVGLLLAGRVIENLLAASPIRLRFVTEQTFGLENIGPKHEQSSDAAVIQVKKRA